MNASVNIQGKSQINIIWQLLKLEGKTNEKPVLYKKTATAFKKAYGIELENAPLIFVKNGSIWKLSHITYTHNGRTYEAANYLPFVHCGDKFKRLEISKK